MQPFSPEHFKAQKHRLMKSCDTPVLLHRFLMYELQNADRIRQGCELEPKQEHTSAVRPPPHTPLSIP